MTIEWAATIGIVVALMTFEFYYQVRKSHEPSFREAAWWSVFYITVAVAFGVSMILWKDGESATEFFAGYITEKSLSVDNLFVFLIILSKFAVPRILSQRVLMFGIVLALILRLLFILAGAAAISAFSWVFYVFGIFLLWTAIGVARGGIEEEEEYVENWILRQFARILPSSKRYHGTALVVRERGKRLVTPLLTVMIAIGSTDVLFAVDSIPAIFGLTTDPFIVFAANAFALMGLRQLYFVVHGLLRRLIYLSYGLAIVLSFIGLKLLLHALHENGLTFINGGKPVESAPDIGIGLSLAFILLTLTLTAILSVLGSRRRVLKVPFNGKQDEPT
ncbi:MAG: TerC/Alx family metal homeostasis membrane protein [Demequinaceae bacterium]|nr:TerC/Alx family metal homeostasis membrane protein [Demequinaceae bacterium]